MLTDKVAFLINNVLVGVLTSVNCEFNFITKTFTNVPVGLTASFENPATDIYKIILTIDDIGTSTGKAIWIAPIDNSNNTVDGGYLDFAFAQWEQGSTATEYFPTTTRLNIPRIDYTNGSCPSLLVEPQRTNLILRSDEFDNVSWTKVSTTVTANSINSPSGNLTADTITATGLIGLRVVQTNTISFTASASYSLSVFAKKGTNNFIQLILPMGVGGMFANFNIDTGVVGTLGTVTGSVPTSSITNFGNGWYRCVINFTATATTDNLASIAIVTSASASRAEANTLTTSVYLWGAQLEVGSYPTSYIPTVASSVTRNADVISKTGISSLIGQTEGTLFFEGRFLSSVNFDFDLRLSDGTANNYITLFNVGLKPTVSIGRSGSVVFNTGSLLSNFVVGQNTKIAITYKNNSFNVYQNGVLKANQNSGSIPLNLQNISISDGFRTAYINSVQLYKTALTDTECIALTTL